MSAKSSQVGSGKKKWIAIGVAAAAVLVAVAIVLVLTLGGKKSQKKPQVAGDNIFEGGDSFTYVKHAKADDFMHIDGVLDEPEWQDKSVFGNRLTDDLEMTGPHLSLTTHMTKKGLYVGATVEDTNITYSGHSAPSKNSTLFFSVVPEGHTGTAGVHNVYMDLGQVLSSSNANIYSADYAVKVDGEANSGETKGAVFELFIPWRSIGMSEPDDPAKVTVKLLPCYYAAVPGETATKTVRAFPYSTASASYWRFMSDGYVDADTPADSVGDSKIGVAKVGVWDRGSLRPDRSRSNANVQAYTGSVGTVTSSNNLIYLSDSSAEKCSFEATVIPTYFEDKDQDYYAGLAFVLPGKRMLYYYVDISGYNYATNARGERNVRNVNAAYTYSSEGSSSSGGSLHPTYGNPNFEKREGIHIKVIKDGFRYYFYVDGELISSQIVSQADGVAMPALRAPNGHTTYTEIRFENFDGREDALRREFDNSGTCLVETEVQGNGELTADQIAVTKGDSVTVTIEPMPGNILSDLLVNGRSVFSDFAANGVIRGTQSLYTITNIQQHITVKAVYTAYKGVSVSGKLTLAGKTTNDISSTEVYAYLADHRVIAFPGSVNTDGTYTVTLPAGTYQKLYFRHNRFEQIFYTFSDGSPLVVGNTPLTNKNFNLTYPTFSEFVIGAGISAGNWFIEDNLKYTAGDAGGGNNYNAAYFRDSGSEDFVVRATVVSEPGAQIGVMMYGSYKHNSGYQLMAMFMDSQTTLFGWHGTARPVNWIGIRAGAFAGNKTVYPDNRTYNIVIAKQGNYLVMYVNGVHVDEWNGTAGTTDGQVFDFSQFTIDKVGFSIRARAGATFSNYSYSSKAADVTAATSRKVTFNSLPSGTSVTVDGRAISSGAMVRYGKAVKVKFSTGSSRVVSVAVNGKPVNSDQVTGEASFTVTEDSAITTTSKSAHSVGGSVAGSGSVTATNTETGEVYRFGGALQNGKYDIWLPDGNYDIYFDAGSTEGILEDVAVSGAPVSGKDLGKSYPKPGFFEHGTGPSPQWVLTGNGVYKAETPDVSADRISMAYFDTLPNFTGTDFLLDTHVNIAPGTSLMVGLAYSGRRGGSEFNGVLGIVNGNNFATMRGMPGNVWTGVRGFPFQFNMSDYRLTMCKIGKTLTYYVNGRYLCSWDISDIDGFDISGMTDVKVGFGIYRAWDATFSDYSYRRISSADYRTISGQIAAGTSGGSVKAVETGLGLEFGGALNADGSYSVKVLGGGTKYNLQFVSGKYEGLLNNVSVGDSDVTAETLGKLYQKPSILKFGQEATFDWFLTENGRYEISTSNASLNALTEGYFDALDSFGAGDFTLGTGVNAGGDTGVMIGFIVTGVRDGKDQHYLFILQNNSRLATHLLYDIEDGWATNASTVPFDYDHTDYRMDVTKIGNRLVIEVDHQVAASYDISALPIGGAGVAHDLRGLTDARVGFGIYRSYDVAFYDYEYTRLTDENYHTVSGKASGAKAGGSVEAVDERGFTYSGTVDGEGNYTVRVPDGTYGIHLVFGDKEGYIPGVEVSGADVEGKNLDKLYQKPTFEPHNNKYAGKRIDWVLTDNGEYQLRTNSDGGDVMAHAYFDTLTTFGGEDFMLETRIRPDVNNSQITGFAFKGMYGDKEYAGVLGIVCNSGYSTFRWMPPEGSPSGLDRWGAGQNFACPVTKEDFTLKVVKIGSKLAFYVGDGKLAEWDLSKLSVSDGAETVDVTGMTNVKVGFGIYRAYNVTFSDYKYTPAEEFAKVSGTVGGVTEEGTVTATETATGAKVTGKLNADGTYSLALPDGTYDLYFTTGDAAANRFGVKEGLLKGVTVSGKDVSGKDLGKVYQKPTPDNYNGGSCTWTLVENGRYDVTPDDESHNAFSFAYFDTVDLATADFTLDTRVTAGGDTSVMIGLVMVGRLGGATRGEIFALQNNAQMGNYYEIDGEGWAVSGVTPPAYNQKDFRLTIVKLGSKLTFLIDGKKACEWDLSNANGKGHSIMGMTGAKVGFGIYRKYPVSFSDYKYTPAEEFAKVSGTVGGVTEEGTVTATETATGAKVTGKLGTDGTYSLALPDGTYDLYFIAGDAAANRFGVKEGLLKGVTVSGKDVSGKGLAKLYQKPVADVYGDTSAGSIEWVLTDNGKYVGKTNNTMSNLHGFLMLGHMDTLYTSATNSRAESFRLTVHVEAAGENPVMIGLVLRGKLNGQNCYVIFGLNNSNYQSQIYRHEGGQWGNAQSFVNGNTYDRKSFDLTINRVGEMIYYSIDGEYMQSFDLHNPGGNVPNLRDNFTDVDIGIGIYRAYDVTFSDFTYEPGAGTAARTNASVSDTPAAPSPAAETAAPVTFWRLIKKLFARLLTAIF